MRRISYFHMIWLHPQPPLHRYQYLRLLNSSQREERQGEGDPTEGAVSRWVKKPEFLPERSSLLLIYELYVYQFLLLSGCAQSNMTRHIINQYFLEGELGYARRSILFDRKVSAATWNHLLIMTTINIYYQYLGNFSKVLYMYIFVNVDI